MINTGILAFRNASGTQWRFALLIAAATVFSIAACTSGSDVTAPPTGRSPLSSTAVPSMSGATDGTPIRVTIGNTVLTGRLSDNTTARDLIAQLPLTLTFSDLNNVEKIGQLPRELSTDGVPEGDDPVPQDIGYYAPSGDLVFYYGDVGYFRGIVRIGRFDGSMEVIANQTGDFTATVELAD